MMVPITKLSITCQNSDGSYSTFYIFGLLAEYRLKVTSNHAVWKYAILFHFSFIDVEC